MKKAYFSAKLGHVVLLTSASAFAALPATAQLTFYGSQRTYLQSSDVFGNPTPVNTFDYAVLVQLKEPLQLFDPFTGTVTTETNPFNLFIATDTNAVEAPGSLTVSSANITDSFSGGKFMQQFWALSYSGETRRFEGVFTDSQFGNLAANPNLIFAPYPLPGIPAISFPYVYATGTQLVGQFSPNFDQLRVEISGATSDLGTQFFSEIETTFVNSSILAADQSSLESNGAAIASYDATYMVTSAVDSVAVPEPNAGWASGVMVALGLIGGWFKTRAC